MTVPIFAIVLGFLALLVLMSVRIIPNDRIGVVEKHFSAAGSVRSGLIAMNGEAGFQPKVLRGGLHILTPIQYSVHVLPLVTIPQGRIGYVFARDGLPLSATQTLASNVKANSFEDVITFLGSGGQRGPQRTVLREGTYALNLAQFVVITQDKIYCLPLNRDDEETFRRMAVMIGERGGFQAVVIKGSDDQVGVVTVHDGAALRDGEIIAPVVGNDPAHRETYHNNFQDPEKFLAAGGRRGRQHQVLVDGTYYVNRLFATVEMIPKTIVEVGYVGVVVSYTGDEGLDLSGEDYKHGELVKRGLRGVWAEPMMPGKYAFNTYAGKIILVPTTNFILKWIKSEAGAHKFDENLSEVSLITKDAFEPSLPLSVVVHIDYKKAPLVIQRFGDIKKLVEQTLDPMVSAYFKNVAQRRTLIQLLQERGEIQLASSKEMREKFEHYNLELEEVLIGTPGSANGESRIETILSQLRARQVAEEQVETYAQQEKAACKERELREAEARARQQQKLTESELSIQIQNNEGKADYQRAQHTAAQLKMIAAAEADKLRSIAEAEAEKVARIGLAEAMAIEEQVRAYGGPQLRLTQEVMNRFAAAIEQSRVDVVPKIVIGGGNGQGGGSNGNVMEALLTMMLSEKLAPALQGTAPAPRSTEVEELRMSIRDAVSGVKPVAGKVNGPVRPS